jgi:hypothetical protein
LSCAPQSRLLSDRIKLNRKADQDVKRRFAALLEQHKPDFCRRHRVDGKRFDQMMNLSYAGAEGYHGTRCAASVACSGIPLHLPACFLLGAACRSWFPLRSPARALSR